MINPWTPEENIVLHQALGKVAEEAAELAKIATRCMIQGFDEAEPVTGMPNRQALREEVADLKAALRWLYEIIDEPYKGESQRERRKFDGFREWQAMLEAEAAKRPFRDDDIRRGLILFRTSNNAHGFTNCISIPSKLDELPQEAKDEIAITMHNMAASLAPEAAKNAAAPIAFSPSVEKLEWYRKGNDWYAQCVLGTYGVGYVCTSYVARLRSVEDDQWRDDVLARGFDEVEAAKAAAQADYDTRILSQITNAHAQTA